MATDNWSFYPLDRPRATAAGVPHRFGIGVLMILVTFFSVLFALLASVKAPLGFVAVVGVLFAGVAAGQSLLFGGRRPRAASILVGTVLFPLEMLGVAIYQYAGGEINGDRLWQNIGSGMVCVVIFGAMLGYAAGGVTATIFLAMNGWAGLRGKGAVSVALRSFTEADIDTLLGWVCSRAIQRIWSRGVFESPVDRRQIEQHLERAAGAEADLLAFKAVCGETGRMVGFVELRDIDRRQQSATIDLALIAPDEPDRGGLSIALLRAILEVAFVELKLRRVQTIVSAYAPEPRGRYKAMGFRSEGVLRDSLRWGNVYEDERIMSLLRYEWLWGMRSRYGQPHVAEEGGAADDEASGDFDR